MNNILRLPISFQLIQGEARTISHVSNFIVRDDQVVCSVSAVAAPQITEVEPGINLEFGGLARPFRALWDTGATQTVVEPKVIDELELVSETWATIRGVDGQDVDRPVYEMTIVLAKFPLDREDQSENLISLYPVTAVMLEQNGQLGGDIDILIGMDIIGCVDFALSRGSDGETWCSIRHPSSGYRTLFEGLS